MSQESGQLGLIGIMMKLEFAFGYKELNDDQLKNLDFPKEKFERQRQARRERRWVRFILDHHLCSFLIVVADRIKSCYHTGSEFIITTEMNAIMPERIRKN